MQEKGQKETGAYYTSDAITMFMAENAILPNLLRRVDAQFGIHFEHFQDIFADVSHPKLHAICVNLITEILPAFTVLDNACGPGAFLLASLNVLVQVYARSIYPILGESALHDAIYAHLQEYGKGENWLQWRFQSFEAFLADSRWKYEIKRQIIIKNLYGVDIDKDAIVLAKSRLWSAMASEFESNAGEGAPCLNIDYNIRCGNSLVGYVRLRPRWNFDQILSFNQLINYVEECRTVYPRIAQELEIYAQSPTIGNLLAVRSIMIQLFKQEYNPEKKRKLRASIANLFEVLQRNLSNSHFLNLKTHWPHAKEITESDYLALTPFHWISEFPEVLLNHGGFDVVLGNPPYITMKKQTKFQKGIYGLKYRTFHANGDVYYLFIERSFALLNSRGSFTYIIPRYFLKAPTAVLLRKFLAEQHLTQIYDFGQSTVFQGVGIHTLILFACPSKDQEDYTGTYSREIFEQFQANQMNLEQIHFTRADLQREDWLFLPPAEQEVFRRIYQESDGLFSDFCFLSKGLQTGKDEVFVIDEEKCKRFQIEPDALVPFMKGSGVKRFFIQNDKQLFLIFSTSHEGDAVMRLPNCAAYLTQNRTKLEDRTRVPWWYQWRLGDERITLQWKQPKIVTASRGSHNIFAIDRCGFYFSQDMTFIQPLPEHAQYLYYFWAVLNSTITRLLMHWLFKELAEDMYEIFPEQIRKIPVKRPDVPTLERINKIMQEIERQAPFAPVEDTFREVDALIYHIYTGQSLPHKDPH